uniref:Uncharacterized protein n=1 Tax=Anguilla anguilla TaxID=7936 RepID=A0A0E9X321_ANGAN
MPPPKGAILAVFLLAIRSFVIVNWSAVFLHGRIAGMNDHGSSSPCQEQVA